jgi:hypothetical protein
LAKNWDEKTAEPGGRKGGVASTRMPADVTTAPWRGPPALEPRTETKYLSWWVGGGKWGVRIGDLRRIK